MVLAASQVTEFFEDATQMAIQEAMKIQFHEEGMNNISDLVDFDEDTFKQFLKNLRRPGGCIPVPRTKCFRGSSYPNATIYIWSKVTDVST